MLKTHDQAFIKKKVTALARGPKKAGIIIPGRKKSMKEVNIKSTQAM